MTERAQPVADLDRDHDTKPTAAAVDSNPGISTVVASRDPHAVAELVRQHPSMKSAVFAMLQQSVGNHFVRNVIDILDSANGTSRGGEASGPMRVTADVLNVRSAPGKHEHNVVGTLQQHELVHATSRSGDWVKLEYKGQPAYAFGDFLKPAKAEHVDPKQAATAASPAVAPPAPAPVLAPPARVSADTIAPTAPALAPPAHVAAPTTAPAAPVAAPVTHDAKTPAHVDATKTAAAPPEHAATETKAAKENSVFHNYQHLEGGVTLDVDPTSEEEATVLNAVRDDDRKLDPIYLKQLQDKLVVANKSGAFNTETLRALRTYYKDLPLDKKHHTVNAEAILKGEILTQILPGTPIKTMQSILGSHAQRDTSITPHNERKADAMARVAGYADYTEMQGQFTNITLLGRTLGRGMPHLAQRVQLADAFLKQRHPLDEQNKTWAEIAQNKLGWNYTGQAAYAATANEIGKKGFEGGVAMGPHMHSAGLALDIDVSHNPYVFAGGDMAAGSAGVDPVMTKHLERAAKMYGGDVMTPLELFNWTKRWSTEELFAKIDTVSKSLGQYLALSKKDNPTIAAALVKAGLPSDPDSVDSVKRFEKFFHNNLKRDQADGLTNHSMDMVVALRDVAGLAWGGAEMSERQNGDFMHFDLRNEKIGKDVHLFSLHNQDNVDDERLQDPPAKKKP